MKNLITGQIYRVQVTGIKRSEGKTLVTKNEYAMIGDSSEDIRLKFAYVVDVSSWDEYRIDYVIKDPDRCCLIRHSSEWVTEESPDANIKREDGTQPVFIKSVVTKDARRYVVHAVTACFASNEEHAKKKLRKRATDGVELIDFMVEEVPVGDDYAKPKDISHLVRARIIGMHP